MSIADALIDRMYPALSTEAQNPVGWIEQRLDDRLWSKQREIAESVRDHRYTAVQSAHATGKSFLAARLCAHWISTHPVGQTFAITTAPTGPQISAVVWRELAIAHSSGGLQGRINHGAVPEWKIGPHLVAQGRKPQDLVDPEQASAAFQGVHARYLLVVLDEAAGIPKWLWDAVDSLATSADSRVFAIGNPTDPSSQFAKVCQPGSGWNVIQVSAFDTPAFTGEKVRHGLLDVLVSESWVEERRKRWGEDTPLYTARVLGEFPEESEHTLISARWVREAQERELASPTRTPTIFGVDVARAGNDKTVIYANRGGVVRLKHEAQGQDLMQTTGVVARLLEDTRNARAVATWSASVAGSTIVSESRGSPYSHSRAQGARRGQSASRTPELSPTGDCAKSSERDAWTSIRPTTNSPPSCSRFAGASTPPGAPSSSPRTT